MTGRHPVAAGRAEVRLAEHVRSRQPEALHQTSPWVLAEQVRLAQTLAVGAVAMLAGWYGLSSTVALSRQATYLVVGLAGLLLSSTGLSLWLLAGLRAIRSRRVLVRNGILVLAGELPQPRAADARTEAGEALVAAAPMTRFHRESCLLVDGKAVAAQSRAAHLGAGRIPCGVCQP